MPKVMAAQKRLHSINPNCDIQAEESFYTAESRQPLFSYHPDFVIDAIDMVSAKLDLIEVCQQQHIPLISCLGTGNRLDPSKFQVGDISETAGCGCGPGARHETGIEKTRNHISACGIFYGNPPNCLRRFRRWPSCSCEHFLLSSCSRLSARRLCSKLLYTTNLILKRSSDFETIFPV